VENKLTVYEEKILKALLRAEDKRDKNILRTCAARSYLSQEYIVEESGYSNAMVIDSLMKLWAKDMVSYIHSSTYPGDLMWCSTPKARDIIK